MNCSFLFVCLFVSLEFKQELLRKKYEEKTGSQAEEMAKQESEEHCVLMAWNNQENLRLLKARCQSVNEKDFEGF